MNWNQLKEPVAAMARCHGRIICTGVGKSGHVARKCAATLASIAKPAHFVHATEASHGDLGVVQSGDICIAFSHSGNTPELSGIVDHCGWMGIQLVAVTSNPDSMLVKASDFAIIYPQVSEAFANAPTTSTTAQIVIGDALAVGLAEYLGKQAGDFHANHPGGAIGQNRELK